MPSDPIKNSRKFFQIPLHRTAPGNAAGFFAGLGKAKIKEISDAVSELYGLNTCAAVSILLPLRRTQDDPMKTLPHLQRPNTRKGIIAIIEKMTLFRLKNKKFNGRYLLLGELDKTGELEPEQNSASII